MSIEALVHTQLPLNRKERFYTATVLPMLICRDNFKYLHLFLKALPRGQDLGGAFDPAVDQVLFFTEYGFFESLIGNDHAQKRFPNAPARRVTPDVMILLMRPSLTALITIEAKMFSSSSLKSLRRQMNVQRELLDYIGRCLGIEEKNSRHIALVPQGLLGQDSAPRPEDFVYWEEILQNFETEMKDDPFLDYLRIALANYSSLRAPRGGGLYCDKMMTGAQIVSDFRAGTLGAKTMGRKGGLRGELLREDISSGKWTERRYETNRYDSLANDNWFFVRQFIERLGDLA